MALCEGQLESALQGGEQTEAPRDPKHMVTPPDVYPASLSVDYRSPRSHFLPPQIEQSARQASAVAPSLSLSQHARGATDSPESVGGTPAKRKRGRPRVDKSSPEYQARAAARLQAREMAAVMSSSSTNSGKRKRGRPRVDKTSAEYQASRRAKQLEAMEKKAQRQHSRHPTGEGAASTSGGGEVRVKRKYTKRAAGGGSGADAGGAGKKRGRKRKTDATQPMSPGAERPRGKRGRRRKSEMAAAAAALPRHPDGALIINSEPIPVDSEDEADVENGQDSLDLDENLRALRHLHEKYAHLNRDPPAPARPTPPCIVLDGGADSPRASPAARAVERLSSTSSSGSSASESSSSSSSASSSSCSSSSDGEDGEAEDAAPNNGGIELQTDERLSRTPSPLLPPPAPAWLLPERERTYSNSESGSETERESAPPPTDGAASLSESDNESPDKSFPCTQCNKWFSTNVTLKIHKRKHLRRANNGTTSRWRKRAAGTYECDCCPESFSCRELLHQHKSEKHRGRVAMRCETCRRCFEDERELAAHVRAHTPDERASRCSECGAQFERWEQLRRHRQCVHPSSQPASRGAHPYACNQCGKAFGHAHSLTRHLVNHSKAVFRCVVCKACFGHADLLAQHLNSHLANYKKLKP